MPSIGETLREARMRQRLDIADVEERTKIRAKYLRALENEEFALLPGPTFARTFLRTYAEVLGLDPHVLVEEYRTNYEREEEMLDVQAVGGPPPPPRDRPRRYTGGPPSRLTVVAGGVVLLLAFLLVLGLTGGDDQGDESAQTSETTETSKRPAKRKRKKPRPLPSAVTLEVTPT